MNESGLIISIQIRRYGCPLPGRCRTLGVFPRPGHPTPYTSLIRPTQASEARNIHVVIITYSTGTQLIQVSLTIVPLAHVVFLGVVWTFERSHALGVYPFRNAAGVRFMISEGRSCHFDDWESGVPHIF